MAWCTAWYDLRLRDVLHNWPEWCHVVTVAVSREKRKQTRGTCANDADEDPIMCVVHVLNGQTGFHFNNSQRSVSVSLFPFCSLVSITVPRWCCHVLYIGLGKKEYFMKLLFKYTGRDLSFFNATGFAVYMVFLLSAADVAFFFFTPLLLLLCFSPRFNDDVILLFDPSTFAFPSSNLYPKAVSRHLDSESNYRSSVPFFSPNPPLWLGPAAVVKTTTLAYGLDHLFSFFFFFLPLNVSVNLWNLSECSKNGPNMPGLL